MTKKGTILLVDDNKSVLMAVELLLKSYFEKVITSVSPERIPSILAEEKVDVILLDMNFSAAINTGNEGLFWLARIKELSPEIPVVLFTAYADIELAVKAVKEGAADFVVKPWDNAKLVATLLSAYRLRESQGEVKQLREEKNVLKNQLNREPSMLWGTSPAIMQVYNLISKVAKTDANVLITGENGTGKEMIAREIHRLSNRSSEVMISVDMGAVTETLFESELFGHVKGAFTDAKEDRAGKFEAANKGTLFLDEIGNLSYALQAKLLTALQSRKIARIGSNKPIDINIRLVCATNRNVQQMVEKGVFREDLLYRINTIHVEVPPLRDRTEDIVPLAEYFLKKYMSKYGKENIKLQQTAKNKLMEYRWPGNIRELQHTIEKAVIMCEGDSIKPSDFFFKTVTTTFVEKNETLEEMERQMIKMAIDRSNGNLSAVASQLGITRQTLYNKMKKYNL
ncbi:sigma-54-dependent transcriptional regulator [Odoribacter lunatus]|uniref:sigma-54-dependent transcriptional regulator n=1 Tax=Odoribacter lunatus TaxID=2941335 RepID=UPI002040D57E|nr:sigma-54 dependent transcriptional regulator [Odoribacter lunatus]